MTIDLSKYAMRHDCSKKGCWNIQHRPRLELLKECFPGEIKPSDVDGTVEWQGYFLFMEFKGSLGAFDPPRGRRFSSSDIYHINLTSQYRLIHRPTMTLSNPTTTTLYVVCDAEIMNVENIRTIYEGKMGEWEDCDLDGLRKRCLDWVSNVPIWSEDDRARARARQAVADRTATP